MHNPASNPDFLVVRQSGRSRSFTLTARTSKSLILQQKAVTVYVHAVRRMESSRIAKAHALASYRFGRSHDCAHRTGVLIGSQTTQAIGSLLT